MSMIDDKLKAIEVPTKIKYSLGNKEPVVEKFVMLPPETIAQIKQAFAEASNSFNVAMREDGTIYKAMTGQEWYNRFLAEVAKQLPFGDMSNEAEQAVTTWLSKCDEAAHRAAGIE